MFETYVMYKQGQERIECALTLYQGELRASYSGEPIDQFSGSMMPLSMASDLIDEEQSNYYTAQGWEEVTEEDYWDMLECLPPYGYVTQGRLSGFLMSEFTSGNFTGCYVKDKVTGKYYCTTVDAYNYSPMLNKLIGENEE